MCTVCSDASPVYLEDIATEEPHSFGSSEESIVFYRHLSFDHLYSATDTSLLSLVYNLEMNPTSLTFFSNPFCKHVNVEILLN